MRSRILSLVDYLNRLQAKSARAACGNAGRRLRAGRAGRAGRHGPDRTGPARQAAVAQAVKGVEAAPSRHGLRPHQGSWFDSTRVAAAVNMPPTPCTTLVFTPST